MKKKIAIMTLAILVAILIWLQVNLLGEQDTTIEIPIRIINIPADLYLYTEDSLMIQMGVRGSGFNILLYHLSNQSIDYNGSDVVLGENILDMSRINHSLAHLKNLTFSPINPDHEISFTTDRILPKQVPVILDFMSDNDRQTFIEQSIIIDDYMVQISGPSLAINLIESVYTEKISADILLADELTIQLVPINEHIIIVPPTIQLVKTPDIVATQTLSQIPIVYDERRFSIHPTRVHIRVEGKLDALNSLSARDIQAYIENINYEDNAQVPIQFKLPTDIKLIDFTPSTVSVKRK